MNGSEPTPGRQPALLINLAAIIIVGTLPQPAVGSRPVTFKHIIVGTLTQPAVGSRPVTCRNIIVGTLPQPAVGSRPVTCRNITTASCIGSRPVTCRNIIVGTLLQQAVGSRPVTCRNIIVGTLPQPAVGSRPVTSSWSDEQGLWGSVCVLFYFYVSLGYIYTSIHKCLQISAQIFCLFESVVSSFHNVRNVHIDFFYLHPQLQKIILALRMYLQNTSCKHCVII